MGQEKWHIEEDSPVIAIDPGSVYSGQDPKMPGELVKLTSENPRQRTVYFWVDCKRPSDKCRLFTGETQPMAGCLANFFWAVPEKLLGPKIKRPVFCGQDSIAKGLIENAK